MTSRIGSGDAAARAAAEMARQRQIEAAREAARKAAAEKQAEAKRAAEAQKKQAAEAQRRDSFVDKSDKVQLQKNLIGEVKSDSPDLLRNPNKLNPPNNSLLSPPAMGEDQMPTQARMIARNLVGKLTPPSEQSLHQEGPLAGQATPAKEGIFGTAASLAQRLSEGAIDAGQEAATGLGQAAADVAKATTKASEDVANIAQTVAETATGIGNAIGQAASSIGQAVTGQLEAQGPLQPEGGLRPAASELPLSAAQTGTAPANADRPTGPGPSPNAVDHAAQNNTQENSTLENVQAQIDQLDLNDAEANAIFRNAREAITSDDPAERLEAGLNTLNQLREALPAEQLEQLPDIAQQLSRGLPAATEFVGLATTLTDPNASNVDKAQAALDFANEAGSLLNDDSTRAKLTSTLDRFGAGIEAVELVNTVTDPDASALDKAKATIDFAGTLGDLLPEGKRQQLFGAIGGLGAPIATVENALTLTDPDASLRDKAEAFVGLVGGLGDSVESVRDIGRALDDLGVSRALGLGAGSRARGIFDDAAQALDGVASKLGARVGTELLQSAGKALGKILPAIGAAVSGYDTVRLGRIAADGDLPGEIRYIAGLGAGINAADTALGITEALGIGNVGLPANIALGVGGFAADIATSQMINDHENGNFNPSDELRAFIGASAVVTAPVGLANLSNAFGIGGSIDVLKDTVKVGGELAGRAADALFEFVKDQGEEAIREVGEFVSGLPGEVQEQIGDALGRAGDLFGDAAGAFVEGLGDAAGALKDLLPDINLPFDLPSINLPFG